MLFWVKHCRQIIVIYIRSLWTVLLTFVRRSWQKRYSYVGWKSSWDLILSKSDPSVAWLGSRRGKLAVPDRYRHQVSDSTILHLPEPIWPDWPSYWPLKNCQTKRLNNFFCVLKKQPQQICFPLRGRRRLSPNFHLVLSKNSPKNLLPLTGSPEAIAKFSFGTFKK